MSGKGDTYRPVDAKKYADNWERIFNGGTRQHDKSTALDAALPPPPDNTEKISYSPFP